MIELTEKFDLPTPGEANIDTTLTLPLESRVKSRLRAKLDDGRDVGLFLERGQVLKHGDLLTNKDGIIIKVLAANETVSTVICEDALLIARASYHLGNRHVAVQIKPRELSYLHDHVLDEMLAGLGLNVEVKEAPFEPESGAYASAGSHHHHH
jgi:urease accessory protein